MSEREVKREELTDEERDALENDTGAGCGRKALRIIDAHAADRAALVAQLEAAKKKRATCSLNSACSAPLRQGLHSIMKVDGIKLCTVCGASEPRPEEDAGPDGEADPDYPPHREHFAPTHAALVAQVAAPASPVAPVKVGDETYLLRNGKRYRGRVKWIRDGLAVCDFQWGNGALWQEGIPLESLEVVK